MSAVGNVAPTPTGQAGEHHLSMQDLADRFGVPLQSVRVWRMKGYGPRGFAVGKHVRYRLADVCEWEQSQLDREHA